MRQPYNQLSSLPGDVQAFIGERYRGQPVVVQPLPYWSTTRVAATRAAGPPVVLTVAAGTQIEAFSYAINGDMGPAGRAGVNANSSDTNLKLPNQTRDNATVFIWGLAAYFTQDSEPLIATRAMREIGCTISTNGNVTLPLGTLEMFPGGGGLYGSGRSFIAEPDLATPGGVDGGAGAATPMFSNGNPMAVNYFRIPQPVLWEGVGDGGSDNTLSIQLSVGRAIALTCAVARAAGAGVSAYTPPAAAGNPGTFVDIRWRLICVSVSNRSKNA